MTAFNKDVYNKCWYKEMYYAVTCAVYREFIAGILATACLTKDFQKRQTEKRKENKDVHMRLCIQY